MFWFPVFTLFMASSQQKIMERATCSRIRNDSCRLIGRTQTQRERNRFVIKHFQGYDFITTPSFALLTHTGHAGLSFQSCLQVNLPPTVMQQNFLSFIERHRIDFSVTLTKTASDGIHHSGFQSRL